MILFIFVAKSKCSGRKERSANLSSWSTKGYKDNNKDSNASRDVLLVPAVEEVIHFGHETSSCSCIGAIAFGGAAHFPFSLSH